MAHSMKVAWRLIAEIYCIDFYPTGKLVYEIDIGTFVRDIRRRVHFVLENFASCPSSSGRLRESPLCL